MNLVSTSLHQIDHALNEIGEITIQDQSQDLMNYTTRLIHEITTSTNRRQFQFRSDTTEVRTALNKFLTDDFQAGAEINAKRLLEVEIEAQQRIAHLDVTIQKGSLFQALLHNNESKTIILSKADHNKFLDDEDFTLKNGLPWEKRIFKAFLVKFNANDIPLEIFVYDTTSRMARYWWDDYLELKETYTDSHNTKTSLDILDRKVLTKIKKDYPADHTILRNSTIGYYRNKVEFALEEYIDEILRNYTPINEDLPINDIIAKAADLPEKWHFDSRFNIQKDEIQKRKVNRIPLNDKVDLVLKDYIENLSNMIKSEKDAEGIKYIKIRTDAGYDRFEKQNTPE
ncbi:MAG: hypothetical protein KDC80_09685 [Saprospiraceae bacterium]|nr:hypothetical protein [Saprospiraceae bacterium]